jgi:hypothetical protein
MNRIDCSETKQDWQEIILYWSIIRQDIISLAKGLNVRELQFQAVASRLLMNEKRRQKKGYAQPGGVSKATF